jgi:hypothetical protein
VVLNATLGESCHNGGKDELQQLVVMSAYTVRCRSARVVALVPSVVHTPRVRWQ